MRHPNRRSPRARPTPKRARPTYRPAVESLEDRTLLSTTTIDPQLVPLNLPAGKSLIIPVSGTNSMGQPVNYNVSTNDPNITVTSHTGDTFLQMTVAGFGTMEFELFNDLTPNTVNYISGLVQSEFYNGLTFHRILKGFAVQGGDPNGNGTGGPPGPGASQTQLAQLQFDNEFSPQAIFDGTAQLALANSGPDTNGSQFFITDGTQRSLDYGYTIFGQLVRGFNVLQAIENVPVVENAAGTEVSQPVKPPVITSVQIIQDPTAQTFTLTSHDTSATPFTLTVTATAADGSQSTQTTSGQVITDTTNDPPYLSTITVNGTALTAPSGYGGSTVAPNQDLDQNGTTPMNTPATVQLSSFDLEGDTPTYSLTETDATAEATIAPVTGMNGEFTVTPNTGFSGTLNLQATVTESGATRSPDSEKFTIAVGDQPLTPGTAGASFSATEGANAGDVSLGTFTDADLTAQASDYAVAINWGDGTALDTTSGQVTGTGGTFSVTGSHTYAEAGKFVARVTVTDNHGTATGDMGGAQTTLVATATVADAALSAQGSPLAEAVPGIADTNAVVATFTDADPNGKASDYTATINWGDGTSSPGTIAAAGNDRFEVLGTHAYLALGTFTVNVSITDVNTSGFVSPATASAQTTVTVTSLDQRFVSQAFLDLTGAPPTPAQLATFTALVPRLGRTGVALQIEKLPAFNVHQVLLTYLQVFGTLPNMHQLRNGVHLLTHGGTVKQLAEQLYASDTYFRAVARRSLGTFLVTAAVGLPGSPFAQGILGSFANTVNLDLLLAELRAGVTRDFIINHDLETVPGALFKEGSYLFTDFVHRPATATEAATEAVLLGSGVPLNTVIAELIGSDTYLRHLLFGT